MILKSRHHFFLYNFFRLFYARWKIGQHFHKVYLSGNYSEQNKPLFVVSNHVSWWDGIWIMYLNIEVLKRKFHFMMLEEQIRKNKVCNQVGGYSVKKGSRSIIESLAYTAELLRNKSNMVLVFPQGKIESLYTPSIQFENGFNNVLKKISPEVQVLFLVNLVDYLSNTKPSLSMYYKEYDNVNLNADKMQADYNEFYTQCIKEQLLKVDNE